MRRNYTKVIACRSCGRAFLMSSAASKFCKVGDCVRKRRRAARQASAQRQPGAGSSQP